MTNYIKTRKELEKFFEEEYYNSINYSDYLKRTDKYIATANNLIDLLQLDVNDSVLDYGCAVGHLLYGFQKAGLKNLNGVDISSWAIANSPYTGLNLSDDITGIKGKEYSVCTILDVFEHMFDDQIDEVMQNLSADKIIIRVPCKLPGQDDFHLEVSRKDPSHVNCKTQKDWVELFSKYGYTYTEPINTKTIYNSVGCFCGVFSK